MRDIALVLITDGRRQYLHEAVTSLREMLTPFPSVRLLTDDSGDSDYAAFLAEECADFALQFHSERRGFAATVEDAWRMALAVPGVEYVFHAEDDFVYNEPVELGRLANILDRYPWLAQVALKRQPVNSEEQRAGGFMQARPLETWREQRDSFGDVFVEHELNFTTNPSLISRRALETVMAAPGAKSEPNVTEALIKQAFTFAYLGTVDDPPRVTHIGETRMPAWAA